MQLQIFLSHLNGVWVGGMRIQIRGKTRKLAIQLIFRGVWAREIGKIKHIYQFDSEAGTGKIFHFWELFFPYSGTKCLNFHETYMFRIKTEHISEKAG